MHKSTDKNVFSFLEIAPSIGIREDLSKFAIDRENLLSL